MTVVVEPLRREDAPVASSPSFSVRQRQVVRLIAQGCSSTEIGLELEISPRTARMHADVVRVKLGAEKRRQIPARFQDVTGINPLLADADLAGPVTT
jgi:DNA-binding CsgD family transcriptional regulator